LVIAGSALHAAAVSGTRGTIEWRGRWYSRRDLGNQG
jgi:hypothetical protein